MKMKNRTRTAVHKSVKNYYKRFLKKGAFVPGKTRVPYAGRVFDEKEILNLVDASLDFWLTEGRYAAEFEKGLASFLGARYCVLTNSGSSANLLAIAALKSPLLNRKRLVAGDEVITTACGFPTTVNPIIQNSLIPVFVDIGLGHYNALPELIEKAITPKTKALCLAHTLGNPAEMDAVLRIVRRHGLWLIEDNCDALGSRYRGRLTGAFGDISTNSFYPAHHITMGEGGALITSDPVLRKAVLSLRDWGRDCWCPTGHDNTCGERFSRKCGGLPFGYDHKYVYSHIGYNLKITDLQAAVGCAQLKKLKQFIAARNRNFNYLYKRLKEFEEFIALPEWLKGSEPSWFGFPMLVKKGAPFSRAEIVAYLEKNKIATRMLFGGNLTRQPAYRKEKYRICGRLDNTDLVMNNLFWVGVYPGLGFTQMGFMAEKLSEFMKTK